MGLLLGSSDTELEILLLSSFLKTDIVETSVAPVFMFTCSCPMEGRPGDGPEAMDVTLICPPICPMLLVAMLVAIETLLRFMPLPLYMLLLFCWVNCGDACCCENILERGGGRRYGKFTQLLPSPGLLSFLSLFLAPPKSCHKKATTVQ